MSILTADGVLIATAFLKSSWLFFFPRRIYERPLIGQVPALSLGDTAMDENRASWNLHSSDEDRINEVTNKRVLALYKNH